MMAAVLAAVAVFSLFGVHKISYIYNIFIMMSNYYFKLYYHHYYKCWLSSKIVVSQKRTGEQTVAAAVAVAWECSFTS